ncbi:MAG: acyl-CoA dehydratase activase [Candidatus Helarchaeota archaeon]
MFFAGIDAGSSYCKCIILKDGHIKSKSITIIEGNPARAAKLALNQALSPLKLKSRNLTGVVSTGRNRKKIKIKNEEMTEIMCISKGAHHLVPSLRTIVDLGSFTNKAIKINSKGKVMDYVINDRCASGSGYFLELVSKALEIDINELGEKALLSKNPLSITNNCSIFAESEVIYLINEGHDELDIAAGVCNSIASRLVSLLKKVNYENDITLTGGVGSNEGIRKNLEERLDIQLKEFPIEPIFIGAFGAALFSQELQ